MKMIRKTASLLLAVIMLMCAAVSASAEEAGLLTADELVSFAREVRAKAVSSELLNDPSSDDALSEDGRAFVYPFATLYAGGTEMTENTQVNVIVFTDDTLATPRGITLDSTTADLLSAYGGSNPDMDGDREGALLYLEGDPETGYKYGKVLRDGQRISYIEYGEARNEGGNYSRASIIFTIQTDLVASVRVETPSEPEGAAAALSLYQELEELGAKSGYTRVPTSRDGLALEPFSEADLTFGGISYLTVSPDDFGGQPEDVLWDDGDGSYLRIIEDGGYVAVFSCDSKGENAVMTSYTINSDALEGPRGVRIGDLFHEDFTRFRSENNDSDGLTEVLYGTEGGDSWGMASYADDDGGMTLRYVTTVTGGKKVELYLHYLMNQLNEIIVHTLEDTADAD